MSHGAHVFDVRARWVLGRMAFLAAAALMCTACQSVKTTYLADGRKGYMVSCHGPFKRWSDCVTQAGRLCQSQGYVVRYEDEFSRELIVACAASRDVITGDLRGRPSDLPPQ